MQKSQQEINKRLKELTADRQRTHMGSSTGSISIEISAQNHSCGVYFNGKKLGVVDTSQKGSSFKTSPMTNLNIEVKTI